VKAVLWPRVADAVRAMIAAGDLAPGDLTPAATDLSALTGASAQTCRKAVMIMARSGELDPPASRAGRPRVPGGDGPGPAERELSAALTAARVALSLTQVQLAGLAGLSWTAVHLAETGRFRSQGPEVWARLDRATYSDGHLVRAHAAWQALSGDR
jgi:hypothetical protein